MANFFNQDEDFFAFTYEWPITYAKPASLASIRSVSSCLISGSVSLSVLEMLKCTCLLPKMLGEVTPIEDYKMQVQIMAITVSSMIDKTYGDWQYINRNCASFSRILHPCQPRKTEKNLLVL
jgi:hypothetical protein